MKKLILSLLISGSCVLASDITIRPGFDQQATEDLFNIATKKYFYTLKEAERAIKVGADVNARDSFNRTPLHYVAYEYKTTTIAQILITAGADVNARDSFNRTPLHIAAKNGADKIAEILIQNKADVDARDDVNITPLSYATNTRSEEIAEILIRAGARVSDSLNNHSVEEKHIRFLDSVIKKINTENEQHITAINELCRETRGNTGVACTIAQLLDCTTERFLLASEICPLKAMELNATHTLNDILEQQELERQQIEYLMTILEQAHAVEQTRILRNRNRRRVVCAAAIAATIVVLFKLIKQ